MAKELTKTIPRLSHTHLDIFPSLIGSGLVKGLMEKENLEILPTSALVLTDRSKNSAGFL